MKKHYKSLLIIAAPISLGVLIWKLVAKPIPISQYQPSGLTPIDSKIETQINFPEVTVDDTVISPSEFEWEYNLHIKAPEFADGEASFQDKPSDSLGNQRLSATDSPELRERIIAGLIERKILYRHIAKKVKSFDLNDPKRFTPCLVSAKEIAQANPDFFKSNNSRELLKKKVCEQAIIDQYLEEWVFRAIAISESDVLAHYASHASEFNRPIQITMRQILLANESKAEEIKKRVTADNFASLAAEYSIAPEREKGGLIGPFSKDQLPTLFDIVFSMNPKEISSIIKSEYGYHILMLIGKTPAQKVSLAEASQKIRIELIRIKKLEAYQNWLNTAMNEVPVSSSNERYSP